MLAADSRIVGQGIWLGFEEEYVGEALRGVPKDDLRECAQTHKYSTLVVVGRRNTVRSTQMDDVLVFKSKLY